MRSKAALALLVVVLLPACQKARYDFSTVAPAPAGQANVQLSLDKTGNGGIEIAIEHLAPPARIDGALTSYVAWIQSAGKDPYKLGVLKYNEKKRSAKLSATYSDDAFTLIITVEVDPGVSAPVGARVLEAKVRAPN